MFIRNLMGVERMLSIKDQTSVNAPAAPSPSNSAPSNSAARGCMFEDFARPLVALRFEGGFRPFSNENGFRLFGERIVLIMNKHIPEKISRFFQGACACFLIIAP